MKQDILNYKKLYENHGILHKAEDIILFEGDVGDNFYIVYSGVAKIVKFSAGNMRILRMIQGGSMFGEFCLFNHSIRTATVIAHTDMKLIKLNTKNINSLIESSPDFSWYFLSQLSEKLSYTLELCDINRQTRLDKKIHEYLSFIINTRGGTVSIKSLPNYVNEPKEEVMKIIKDMETLEIIQVIDDQIVSFGKLHARQYAAKRLPF